MKRVSLNGLREGPWTGPAVIGAAAVAMLAWSWRRWPDVVIDFGRQLYVAWRLSEGQTLYRDVAYFKGPLSAYWNAFWFRVLGVGITTLVVVNLMVLACVTWLLYRLLCVISDRIAASLACLTFVLMFGFGQFEAINSYNFVCPYSHEATHGVALALAAIYCLYRYQLRRQIVFLATTGLAVGLVFLTDGPLFFAALIATLAGVGLTLWAERPTRQRSALLCGTFFGSAILPPLVAYDLLAQAMPPHDALVGMLGSLPWTFKKEFASLELYKWGIGVSDIRASLRTILLWTLLYAALFVPPLALGFLMRQRNRLRLWVMAGLFALVTSLLVWKRNDHAWKDMARPLPLLLGMLAVGSFSLLLRQPREMHAQCRSVIRFAIVVLALALLSKMILNTRIWDYGFAWAMPATLVAVVTGCSWAPAWLRKRGWDAGPFRAVALALWCVTLIVHLGRVNSFFRQENVLVGRGVDAFWADGRGLVVNLALNQIAERLPPQETLAVFPEGAMLNYLSRRVNPTPFAVFLPTEQMIYGEQAVLSSLREHPPDHITLVREDTSEQGRFFGRDYGQQVFSWIVANYRDVALIHLPPPQDQQFSILMLERNDHRK
jgi:uncharacterized membrane protein (DUF441 family)